MNTLRIVLPDQLDPRTAGRLDPSTDVVLAAQTGAVFGVPGAHRRKLILVAAAGRHFVAGLRSAGITVDHRTLRDGAHEQPLREHVVDAAREAGASRLVAVRPGSWEELDELVAAARTLAMPLEIEEDPHFFATTADFARHASGRSRLVMEYFYRELRARFGVLMEDGRPVGDQWNYDADNRESFGRRGPPQTPAPPSFEPDEITLLAAEDVRKCFPDAPGVQDDAFDLAVTPDQAREALDAFIRDRLPEFGAHQDAMWTGRWTLSHSLISPYLNLRLIDPRDAVRLAEDAWREGRAPINSVEGFIRQILGWREFIRGVYYHAGRGYVSRDGLRTGRRLPSFYWTGETRMRCVSDVMEGVLAHGYAHHIQRLMVMGLYALLAGLDPLELHRWHLALYLDAWDWVSAPNVIGMSQYADGGLVATKPYAASGKYINRMSNYCRECPYDPDTATGDRACPFTALYWDYLARNRDELAGNRRMKFQVANLDRKDQADLEAIRRHAATILKETP